MTAPVDLPPTLVSGLVGAASAIDPDGELPAAARGRLHVLLDDAARTRNPEAGRDVRARLALASAYGSFPQLGTAPELRDEAEHLAVAATSALRGELGTTTLEAMRDAAVARATGLLGAVDPRAVHALLACAAAVSTVLDDPPLDDLAVSEKEADPADWEACFYASLAWTGGATWEGVHEPLVRGRFWEWYLLVAVPFAWDADAPLVPYPTELPFA